MSKRRSFFNDVVLSSGAEAICVAAGLILVSLVGRWLGAVALAEYLLVRRVSTWFVSGCQLSLPTALTRYVAHDLGRAAGAADSRFYFRVAAAMVLLASLGVGSVLVAGHRVVAPWLFGSEKREALVFALALMVGGLATNTTLYGYYRGLLDMVRANAVNVWNLAVMPLLVLLLLARTRSIVFILGTIGGLMIASSVFLATLILLRSNDAARAPSSWQPCAAKLLRYGIPRTPGNFGLTAMLALGPVVAAHYVPMGRLSSLLLGISILAVLGYGASPVGTVLLSQLSTLLGGGKVDHVRLRLGSMWAAIPEISVFVCIQLMVFSDVIVRVWVGPKFLGEIADIRLVVLAIPAYLFYAILRNAIDAATVKAYNTANVLAALGVDIALLAATVELLPKRWLLEGVAGSLLVALIVLGGLTARTFSRLYRLRIPWGRTIPAVAAACALGGVSLLYRSLPGAPTSPVVVAGLELGMGLAYLGLLWLLGSPWIREAWHMALRERHA